MRHRFWSMPREKREVKLQCSNIITDTRGCQAGTRGRSKQAGRADDQHDGVDDIRMDWSGPRDVSAGGRMDVKRRRIKMKRKKTTIWCYLMVKKHCDVVQWALAANVMVSDAKRC